ncbi:MAG: hypothetical protein NC293_05595, partial [Roseburia sp.]|nr:hypothetical protein [Roseburia sp.]
IRREKSASGQSGFRGIIKQAVESVPEELVKRFHKKNEKRQKKGKEPISAEEYMEILRKANVRAAWGDWIGILLVLLVVVVVLIQTALTSTVADTFLFAGILLVAEIPAGALFRLSIRSRKQREELVAECDRRNITILEYVSEKENEKIS